MILSNFHTHSKFCDGKDTPRELVERAIELGFSSLGFSSHACLLKECTYGVKDLVEYRKSINALKEEYKDKIEIYCAIEEEVYTPFDRKNYDYILGSCHFVEKNGVYYPVDNGLKSFKALVNRFNGNVLEIAEKYFTALVDYIYKRKPDIVGHFDLLTKFDEMGEVFYISNPEYIKMAERFMEKASLSGCIFEVNTGAIARGFRTSFYPAPNLLKILKKNEAKILLSSDCHDKNYLDCDFDKSVAILKDFGFKKLSTLKNGKWIEFNI